MDHKYFSTTPFKLSISFHLLIKHYEKIAATETGYPAEHARLLLKEIEPYPELKNGVADIDDLTNKSGVLKHLLADLFPEALTDNEIKAVSVPFQNFVFNTSRRFQKILNGAGPAFDIAIRDFSEHQVYVMSCCIILGDIYDVHFDFSRPFFYDIPTAAGVMKHYRILYNADFMEVIPNETAIALTTDDINLLRDNFDDISLWKRLFPIGSYTLKGFALVNLFDATIENAVSSLKGTLLSSHYDKDEADVNHVKESIQHVFRSIFKIPDLRVGFTTFNPDENTFSAASFNKQLHSYLLDEMNEASFTEMLCVNSMNCVVGNQNYFSVSDVQALLKNEPDNVLAQRFDKQGIQSFILAPIVKDGNMLGIVELVSNRPRELNSINANTLENVMPYIVDTIDRQYANLQNQIRAIIQNEYTTIHPSVYWKFRREAIKSIDYHHLKKDYALKEITFKNVYPLYGQIDIKGSSETRNLSIQLDLENQLAALIPLVESLKIDNVDLTDEIGELKALSKNLHISLRADTEQYIQNFLEVQIHPIFKDRESPEVTSYLLQAEKTGDFHHHRKPAGADPTRPA